MNALIILVVVLAAFLLGHFYVKRQRNNFRIAREKKLKLAEGRFDSAATPAPRARKRKFWLAWRKPSKPPLPPEMEEQLLKVVPRQTERLLQARHSAIEESSALAKAESHFRSVGVDCIIFPARPEKADMHAWLSSVIATCLEAKRAKRAISAKDRDCREANHAHRRAVNWLYAWLQELDKHDLSALGTQAEDNLELVRLAYGESNQMLPQKAQAGGLPEEPVAANAEAEALLEQLQAAVAEMLSGLPQLSTSFAAARAAAQKMNLAREDPKLTGPQKPNEQETQALITALMNWATEQQEQEEALRSKWPVAEAALTQVASLLKKGQQLLLQLQQLPAKLEEEKKTSSRLEQERLRATLQSASAVDLAASGQEQSTEKPKASGTANSGKSGAAVASATDANASRSWFSLSKWSKTTQSHDNAEPVRPRPWEQYESDDYGRSVWGQFQNQPAAFLTDLQEARQEAAAIALSRVSTLVNALSAESQTWSGRQIVSSEGENAPSDQAVLHELNSAMRKMAFAIAQRNAIQAKLKAAREEGNRITIPEQASLLEPDVETFVRAQRKWSDRTARSQAEEKERAERCSALQQQYEERQKQMSESKESLSQLLQSLPALDKRSSVPPPLFTAILAAHCMRRCCQ